MLSSWRPICNVMGKEQFSNEAYKYTEHFADRIAAIGMNIDALDPIEVIALVVIISNGYGI